MNYPFKTCSSVFYSFFSKTCILTKMCIRTLTHICLLQTLTKHKACMQIAKLLDQSLYTIATVKVQYHYIFVFQYRLTSSSIHALHLKSLVKFWRSCLTLHQIRITALVAFPAVKPSQQTRAFSRERAVANTFSLGLTSYSRQLWASSHGLRHVTHTQTHICGRCLRGGTAF